MGLAYLVDRSALDRIRARDEVVEQHSQTRRCLSQRWAIGQSTTREPDTVVCPSAVSRGRLTRRQVILAGPEVDQHDAAGRLAHHVLGLDVAVQQPDGVRRRQRAAEIDADRDGFGHRERSALLKPCGERLAVDELGPDAGLSVDALGAVDGDDIRMSNAREQTAFLDRPARLIRGLLLGLVEQFQRDLAIEAGVPGAIDIAKCAAADALEQGQWSPGTEGRRRIGRVRVARSGVR